MPALPFLAEQHRWLEELENLPQEPSSSWPWNPSSQESMAQTQAFGTEGQGGRIYSGQRRNTGNSGGIYRKLFIAL